MNCTSSPVVRLASGAWKRLYAIEVSASPGRAKTRLPMIRKQSAWSCPVVPDLPRSWFRSYRLVASPAIAAESTCLQSACRVEKLLDHRPMPGSESVHLLAPVRDRAE